MCHWRGNTLWVTEMDKQLCRLLYDLVIFSGWVRTERPTPCPMLTAAETSELFRFSLVGTGNHYVPRLWTSHSSLAPIQHYVLFLFFFFYIYMGPCMHWRSRTMSPRRLFAHVWSTWFTVGAPPQYAWESPLSLQQADLNEKHAREVVFWYEAFLSTIGVPYFISKSYSLIMDMCKYVQSPQNLVSLFWESSIVLVGNNRCITCVISIP